MTKAVWHWNSNLNPWCPKQEPQWTKYSDIENEIIEKAYQNHQNYVELDLYWIDLEHKVQKKKSNYNKQRPIKRILIENENNLREERFFIPPKLSKTFSSYSIHHSDFINEWIKRNFHIIHDIKKIVQNAIDGIIHEGHLLEQDNEAKWLGNKLIQFENSTQEEINECCVHLYTRESFLYKLLNKTLREDDISKVDTLGPFAYLLYESSSNLKKHLYQGVVYRGAKLESDMIDDYKKALNDGCRSWSGFTSTSRNRRKAEKFGNILFIIDILRSNTAIDVSSLSEYPSEQEVLIGAGWNFSINNIEFDHNGKQIIYIKQD
ncbi:unnamed protein product [Rotaria sordida]|uniref:NAD(P)(+)--arginine ADP-ribosyltransferase n=1 Tax=Rotaria sordida TaxID=392033 RepID=A0A815CEL2_9BILA|nr:unnamed protein product [Rotaria sordida]CAF1279327.1 unnamed protein product [Rotaria sordida]